MRLVYAMLRLLYSNQRKHIFRWFFSLREDYLLQEKKPWLVFDAIDFLKSIPLEGKKVFEYGSGGSTLFWLEHGAELVSIEHDPDWYTLMYPRLKGMTRIDYRLVQMEPVKDKDIRDTANPNLYLSEDPSSIGYNFRNYVCQIDTFTHDYFDLVLIDGRARPACIMHSVSKVKINGLLIVDNADRLYYTAQNHEYLQNFHHSSFYGIGPTAYSMWRTDIYVRKN